ncbi:hypothetical protein FAI40_04250 [Acetobacteraceae bacterium]|nr:hypothetical protein FAI40_04250 [Acetobacteraceae bacterium]
MKKLLFIFSVLSLPFLCALYGGRVWAEEELPSIDKMDEFHPEVSAGKVPTPDIQVSKANPDLLAVVPFETPEEQSETQEKDRIELYPSHQAPARHHNSEPDNPVNNVLAVPVPTDGKTSEEKRDITGAPSFSVAPLKPTGENLFGHAA